LKFLREGKTPAEISKLTVKMPFMLARLFEEVKETLKGHTNSSSSYRKWLHSAFNGIPFVGLSLIYHLF
jgi:hypothetical protein